MRRDDVMTVFNPRSPDGERRRGPGMDQRHHRISIHAPRMGSDTNTYQPQNVLVISIHAPRMGSDRSLSRSSYRTLHFNPRSPDGERLCPTFHHPARFADFNPRSPDGERLAASLRLRFVSRISIHAPRMGSDSESRHPLHPENQFQSTLPGWGATFAVVPGFVRDEISIHAPRMGSDFQCDW